MNIKYFNNISQMKNSTSILKEGDLVKTHGYKETGDGGGAEYIIKSAEYIKDRNITVAEHGEHALGNNLFALLSNRKAVNLKNFGALKKIEKKYAILKYDSTAIKKIEPNKEVCTKSTALTLYDDKKEFEIEIKKLEVSKKLFIKTQYYTGESSKPEIQAAIDFAKKNEASLITGGNGTYLTDIIVPDISSEQIKVNGLKNCSFIDATLISGTLFFEKAKNINIQWDFIGRYLLHDCPFPVTTDEKHRDNPNYIYSNHPCEVGWVDAPAIIFCPIADKAIDAIKISNCHCEMRKNFVTILKGNKYRCSNITVTNNTTEHIWWHGVGSRYVDGITVIGNTFRNHYVGFGADFSSGTKFGVFANNTCYKTAAIGKVEIHCHPSDISYYCQFSNNIYISPDEYDKQKNIDTHWKPPFVFACHGEGPHLFSENKLTLNRAVESACVASASVTFINNKFSGAGSFTKAFIKCRDKSTIINSQCLDKEKGDGGYITPYTSRSITQNINNNYCDVDCNRLFVSISLTVGFDRLQIKDNFFRELKEGGIYIRNTVRENLEITGNNIVSVTTCVYDGNTIGNSVIEYRYESPLDIPKNIVIANNNWHLIANTKCNESFHIRISHTKKNQDNEKKDLDPSNTLGNIKTKKLPQGIIKTDTIEIDNPMANSFLLNIKNPVNIKIFGNSMKIEHPESILGSIAGIQFNLTNSDINSIDISNNQLECNEYAIHISSNSNNQCNLIIINNNNLFTNDNREKHIMIYIRNIKLGIIIGNLFINKGEVMRHLYVEIHAYLINNTYSGNLYIHKHKDLIFS